MFPIKRKREGADGNPIIQKKNVAQNPLQLEPTIEELQPVQSVLDQKLKEWVNVQWAQIIDEDIPPEQKIARLNALEFHAGMNKITEFMTNTKKQFVLDFIKWLQYKDPTDPRHEAFVRETERQLGELGATVRNGPLDVNGKEEWLCNFIDKKVKYDRAILKLRLGPHSTHNWDLHDAWLYYKYILRGEKLPQNDFLSDFDEYFYHKMNPPTLPDVKQEPQDAEFIPGHHAPGEPPQNADEEAADHQKQEEKRQQAQEENPVGAEAVPQRPVADAAPAEITDRLDQLIEAVRENRPRKRARPAEGEGEKKRPKPEVKEEPMEAEATGPPDVQPLPQPPPLPERPPPAGAQPPPIPERPATQAEPAPQAPVDPKAEEDAKNRMELLKLYKKVQNAKDRARKRHGSDKEKRHADENVIEAVEKMGDYATDKFLMNYKEAKRFLGFEKTKPPKDQKKGKQNEPPIIIPPPETEKEKKTLAKLKTKAQKEVDSIAKSRPDAQEEIKAVRQQIAAAPNDVEVRAINDAIPLIKQKLENKDALKAALDKVNISAEVKEQAVAEFSAVPPVEATIDTANQIVKSLMEQEREKTMEVDKATESDVGKNKEKTMEVKRPDRSDLGLLLSAQKSKLKAAPPPIDKKFKERENPLATLLETQLDKIRPALKPENDEEENGVWDPDDEPFDVSKIIGTDKDNDKGKKKDKKEKPVKEKEGRKQKEKENKEARKKERDQRAEEISAKVESGEISPDEGIKQIKNLSKNQDKTKTAMERVQDIKKQQEKIKKDEQKAAEKKRLEAVEEQFKPMIQNAENEDEVNRIYAEYEKAKADEKETQQSVEDLRKAKLKEFEQRRKQEETAEKEKQEQEAQLERNKEANQIKLGEFGKSAENLLATEGYEGYPVWFSVNYDYLMKNRDTATPEEFDGMIDAAKIRLKTRIQEDKDRSNHPSDVVMGNDGEDEQALYNRKQDIKAKRNQSRKDAAEERRKEKAKEPIPKAHGQTTGVFAERQQHRKQKKAKDSIVKNIKTKKNK